MVSNEEFLPCPFCGVIPVHFQNFYTGGNRWHVRCDEILCGVNGLLSKWNTRKTAQDAKYLKGKI